MSIDQMKELEQAIHDSEKVNELFDSECTMGSMCRVFRGSLSYQAHQSRILKILVISLFLGYASMLLMGGFMFYKIGNDVQAVRQERVNAEVQP